MAVLDLGGQASPSLVGEQICVTALGEERLPHVEWVHCVGHDFSRLERLRQKKAGSLNDDFLGRNLVGSVAFKRAF